MLRRGQRLGRYEILETLPETGGMSILYKARNVEDGSRVAVKIPHPRLWDSPRLLLRFAREGEALRKLRHRNIVPVLSVASQDGLPYIVMEYLSGDSLGQLMYKKLYKKEKFSLEEVLNFLRPIADALDYCHSQRVIHCDVKPGNIRITPQGSPVLIDFGIVQSDDCTVFDDGRTPVTPHYTSPEQARGLAATAQSDQYSLAILAYEMLTGHVPFDGNSQKVLAQQRDAEPPLPSDWSQPLKNVMRRALAKAPNERFRSCLEFLQALENPAQKYPPLLASLPPTTAPSDFKAETNRRPPSPPEPQVGTSASLPKVVKNDELILIGVFLALIIVLALIGWIASKLNPPPDDGKTSSTAISGRTTNPPPAPPPPFNLDVKAKRLRFFESASPDVPLQDRKYASTFPPLQPSLIDWEVTLEYEELGRPADLNVEAVLSDAKGRVIARRSKQTTLQAGSTSRVLSAALGAPQSGSLRPGSYRVELNIHGKMVASNSFRIPEILQIEQ